MQKRLQKQPQIKILPVLSVDESLRLREADIGDVIKTVQGAFPQHINEDIDVTIKLLEKNLKIMADMALMKEALTHLVRIAMSSYYKPTLTIDQVHFDIESLRNGDDSIVGACAFLSLAAVGTYVCVDEKIKTKILEPFFTTKTEDNGLGLAMAYRIIKQLDGKINVQSRMEQAKEVNIYLPLTRLEMVRMMSIPAG